MKDSFIDNLADLCYGYFMTVNNELLAVKDIILETVNCEKIYLFGSYVNNTQKKDSDYDLYVVLKDDNENPVFVEQSIYRNLSRREGRHTPVDILAENKTKFDTLCELPTIERKIAREGVLLHDVAGLA
jgi:predicted nucleotidyltransferase